MDVKNSFAISLTAMLSKVTYNVLWLHDVAKSKRKHSIKQPTKQVQK